MKHIKLLKKQVIGIDNKGVVFVLDGEGTWVQVQNTKELFKIL